MKKLTPEEFKRIRSLENDNLYNPSRIIRETEIEEKNVNAALLLPSYQQYLVWFEGQINLSYNYKPKKKKEEVKKPALTVVQKIAGLSPYPRNSNESPKNYARRLRVFHSTIRRVLRILHGKTARSSIS